MSYILDALNKSEQERRDQKTPDLQTVHRAPPPKPQSRTPIFLVVGVFALINLGALGYWLLGSDEAAEGQANVAPSATHSPTTLSPATQQNTQAAASASSNVPSINTRTAQPTITAQSQPTINAGSVSRNPPLVSESIDGTLITPQTAFQKPGNVPVRITELPVNVQRQVPDLVFSSHLYSDEPSFRMVNINGKMIREGDMVANDLKLLEISEEGVILGFRHYVFEVSVLRDWSFN